MADPTTLYEYYTEYLGGTFRPWQDRIAVYQSYFGAGAPYTGTEEQNVALLAKLLEASKTPPSQPLRPPPPPDSPAPPPPPPPPFPALPSPPAYWKPEGLEMARLDILETQWINGAPPPDHPWGTVRGFKDWYIAGMRELNNKPFVRDDPLVSYWEYYGIFFFKEAWVGDYELFKSLEAWFRSLPDDMREYDMLVHVWDTFSPLDWEHEPPVTAPSYGNGYYPTVLAPVTSTEGEIEAPAFAVDDVSGSWQLDGVDLSNISADDLRYVSGEGAAALWDGVAEGLTDNFMEEVIEPFITTPLRRMVSNVFDTYQNVDALRSDISDFYEDTFGFLHAGFDKIGTGDDLPDFGELTEDRTRDLRNKLGDLFMRRVGDDHTDKVLDAMENTRPVLRWFEQKPEQEFEPDGALAPMAANPLVYVVASLQQRDVQFVVGPNERVTVFAAMAGDSLTGGDLGDLLVGQDGVDRLDGAGGPDLIWGGSGNDVLRGGDGRDIIDGGPNSDFIDGGLGTDTVIFTGDYESYSIRPATNEVGAPTGDMWVQDLDGSDLLRSVERFKFYDMRLALDIDGAGGQAYRLYKAAFDRAPDLGGLGFWINSLDVGVSLPQAAAFFITSQEFQATYGALGNSQFLTQLYLNVLDRISDPAGYAYWLDLLDRTVLTRGDVLALFSESTENKANVMGLIQYGIEYEWGT